MLREHEALQLRLRSLLLDGSSSLAAAEIVDWFGAMQAQDLNSARWSLGVRIPSSTLVSIDEAIDAGDIIRTWPMRGTIHFVPSVDAEWMLKSAGARTLSGVQRRWDYLGLDLATVSKATEVLAGNLGGGKRLLRSEAMDVLNEAGIDTAGQRGYHLIWYASQVGVTCIGPSVGKEQTVALLREFAPKPRELDESEAYSEFARRYFRSHGPAAIADFARWVGIPMGIAKSAVAQIAGDLTEIEVGGQNMLVNTEILDYGSSVSGTSTTPTGGLLMLPGFDEFVLGYKERGLSLDDKFKDRIVPGGNGMFRSTIVDDGVIVGTWTRKVRASRVDISLEPFKKLSARQLHEIDERISQYGEYLETEAVRTQD